MNPGNKGEYQAGAPAGYPPFFTPIELRLSKVKPKHIRDFYDYLYKHWRAGGKGGLSISSIKTIKNFLNESFKRAVIEELVIGNSVESVKLPARENPRKPHAILNKGLANRLLGSVINDELMYPLGRRETVPPGLPLQELSARPETEGFHAGHMFSRPEAQHREHSLRKGLGSKRYLDVAPSRGYKGDCRYLYPHSAVGLEKTSGLFAGGVLVYAFAEKRCRRISV